MKGVEIKNYEGSVFTKINSNITLGCITPEASELLGTIMIEWKKHKKALRKSNPKYKPSDYAFAYWLVRWSGLIQPVKLKKRKL
jgi:hypothetical protein